jgi:MFS family permease
VSGAAAAAPLHRQPEFVKLWAGQTVSVFGDQVSALAIPLAGILVLHASAAQMGILSAAVWAPHLVFSIAAGAWVDRRRHRRRLLVATDLARAAALATIPLAYALDALTIGQLYAVAFVVGALTVVFDVGNSAFFPLVVSRAQIVEAQARLSTTRSASYIGGPALAGFLVQLLRAPFAVLADAASFVGSAFFLSRIRIAEPELDPAIADESLRKRLVDGWRFMLAQPVIRAGVGCTSTVNFFNLGFNAIVVLYMSRELHLSAGTIGVVLSGGAVGALVGALVAPRVERAIGIGPAIVIGAVFFPAPLLLFPAAHGPDALVIALLLAGEFFASVGVMVFDINQNSLWFLVTPHGLRARTTGSTRTLTYGVRPLGALLGGLLGQTLGLRPALWLLAAGTLLGVLWLLPSPLLGLRERPVETV